LTLKITFTPLLCPMIAITSGVWSIHALSTRSLPLSRKASLTLFGAIVTMPSPSSTLSSGWSRTTSCSALSWLSTTVLHVDEQLLHKVEAHHRSAARHQPPRLLAELGAQPSSWPQPLITLRQSSC
jgi:hypothetical protein